MRSQGEDFGQKKSQILGLLTINNLERDEVMLEVLTESTHTLQRRQHLAFPGDRMEAVHRVEEGWLARYTRLPSGHRQITGIYLPGDFCEPQWVIDPVSTEWIVALCPARTSSIPLESVMLDGEVMSERPRSIFSDLIRLIARQSAMMVALGRKSGIERLSSVVSHLYQRAVRAGIKTTQLAMPLTQSDLADIVGLTPIHVNRILKEMREQGVLEVNRGSVSVINPDMLQFVTDHGYFGAPRAA